MPMWRKQQVKSIFELFYNSLNVARNIYPVKSTLQFSWRYKQKTKLWRIAEAIKTMAGYYLYELAYLHLESLCSSV